MKTIVETSSRLSKYLLNDADVINLQDDCVIVGDPTNFIVSDLNAKSVIIYENVTAPSDWVGNKYLFDGMDWTANPNWNEPGA